MASISASDPQLLANRAIAATPSPTSAQAPRSEAGAQQASRPLGHSQTDSFTRAGNGKDPVEGTVDGLNSQASDRAGLVNGQFAKMDGISAKSNRAWSWHQLIMELIRLQRPS